MGESEEEQRRIQTLCLGVQMLLETFLPKPEQFGATGEKRSSPTPGEVFYCYRFSTRTALVCVVFESNEELDKIDEKIEMEKVCADDLVTRILKEALGGKE